MKNRTRYLNNYMFDIPNYVYRSDIFTSLRNPVYDLKFLYKQILIYMYGE